ncbi:MAG: hypothetical protein GX025_00715 [Clostridiales bacterium]|nr:hypothetical protein [Clostridiales bacterium]
MENKKPKIKTKDILQKTSVMLLGIFCSALGVSLSIKSGLGATPLGVCPAVFSPFLKISTGTATAILLSVFFLSQLIILKKEFKPFESFQLLIAVIYGFFIDFTASLLSVFPDGGFWGQSLYCCLGIVILALGVSIAVSNDFILLPQDAFVNVISKKYSKEYGNVKITLDIFLTAIAAIGSLILNKSLVQVGVGTIAAAIFVGKIVSLLQEFEGMDFLFVSIEGET